ncbi:hypothetical protein AMC82_CH01060 [Rhizobium phaseoli]|uniref:sigma-70 family RNA polymerase sigma factor n=1 Tax=Rhizobium phaseoli TaxID=396 RepID=UPI0007EA52F7|nr:sigma-70 family RNA polymerase sigma factor [Rhizobium phaseoli]ANL64753.1 hypothetical protein AMC84_CH01063 [Rhizobium phaseoli]ANL77567.1 hypothetical protein AMC82_CH01060 [Rhizobium phaseoli]
MAEANNQAVVLQPLTRKQDNGSLLYRPDELVDELKSLLQRPREQLAASKRDISSAALVYVMRNLRPNRDESWYMDLWSELVSRVGGQALKQSSGLPTQQQRDVREAVCDWLRDVIFSADDRADVLEAFFGLTILRKSIDAVRHIKKRNSIERSEANFETDDGVPRDWLDTVNLRNVGHAMPRAEAAAQVAAVLARLTERERQAVEAVYVEGLAQKSSNPDEVTAATKLGVSPRAVGKLLAKARKRASGDEEEA